MSPTDGKEPRSSASIRVTVPAPPLPTALQCYIAALEAVEQAAKRELPPRHFATLMSVRRRRCEQEERIAVRALDRRGQSEERGAA